VNWVYIRARWLFINKTPLLFHSWKQTTTLDSSSFPIFQRPTSETHSLLGFMTSNVLTLSKRIRKLKPSHGFHLTLKRTRQKITILSSLIFPFMKKSKYSSYYMIAKSFWLCTTLARKNKAGYVSMELSPFCHLLSPKMYRGWYDNAPETEESFTAACQDFVSWVKQYHPKLIAEMERTNDAFERQLPL
jgi:hypothetical protein